MSGTRTRIACGITALVAFGCATEPELVERADRIYHGGIVITLDAEQQIEQAVAIKDGRLLVVGSDEEVMALRSEDTEVVDLRGRTVLPGFVDAHGSFLRSAFVAPMVELAPPPSGTVQSIADVQHELRARIAKQETPDGEWVLGFGYHESMLSEDRHPTRSDLDEVSTEHPVLVVHVSGELAVANGLALERAGIRQETRDPPGGRIGRDEATGEPNGLLEGAAMTSAFEKLLLPDLGAAYDLIDAAQQRYLSAGITTAHESYLGRRGLRALIGAADDELLALDVIGYPRSTEIDQMIPEGVRHGQYYRHFRFGGVAIEVDGAMLAKAAYLAEPYVGGEPDGHRGRIAFDEAELQDLVDRFVARGLQVLAIANGDAAVDRALVAVEKAVAKHRRVDRRPIVAGVQPLSDEQLERMRRLGVVASFPASHTFFWGDWLRDAALGPERAARVGPATSAQREGVRFTLHAGAPAGPPDMLRLLWAAVTRGTRSGAVLGEEQRISVAAAIRAITVDAAYACFEEDRKGTIEVGKLADLVVLSQNPLEVEPDTLLDIEVLETVKEGETVYRKAETTEGPQ